ncbi:MAG: VWA domain-containing protein [Opitutales bacterium]
MSDFAFNAPEWFLLAPLFLFLGWWQKPLRLWMPLRACILALLLLILAEPSLTREADGLDLIVLVDRSDSAAEAMEQTLQEQESLLKPPTGDRYSIRYIDFAAEALPRERAEAGRFQGDTTQTNLASAVQTALLQRNAERPTRLLVLSDGNSTEPLEALAPRLQREGIAMDYRLLPATSLEDYEVTRLVLPTRVQTNETFVIEGLLTGAPGQRADWRLERDGQTLARERVTFNAQGQARLRLADRLQGGGASAYTLRLDHPADPRPGNNRLTQWVEARGGPRILLLTRYEDDPLAAALAAQNLNVESITEHRSLHPGRLAGAQAVILNDVPFHRLPEGFADALAFYVREQGGGLLMVGGRNSFGSGGYAQSPLDAVLPVSMELKQEQRKLAVALAIVMDRSGSMSAGVAGTPGKTKMDLANSGAANAVNLLGAVDAVTVFAVDSKAHPIVPLTNVEPHRATIQRSIHRIESRGGGIFVYNGLKAAWDQLKGVQVGQRHIVLFSDAADSEQPDRYKDLLTEVTDAGGTVSVIGLGTRTDADAAFLEDIANRGNGRIYFTNDARRIPSIFSQETVVIARSMFVDEPALFEPVRGWGQIAAREPAWMPTVGSYNICYPRTEATVTAITNDENTAPLIAFWQRGAGRAAAVTFTLSGPNAAPVLQWEDYSNFAGTLTRWLSRPASPPGQSLRSRVNGNQLEVELFYDEQAGLDLAKELPRMVYAQDNASGEPSEGQWERLRPGLLRATVPLEYGKPVRGAVRAGEFTLPFGPLAVGQDLEWRTNPDAVDVLRQLSANSGGTERIRLPSVWEERSAAQPLDLRIWLTIILLAATLAEAFNARTGLLGNI